MIKQLLAAPAARQTRRAVTAARSLLDGMSLWMLDVGAADGAPVRWQPYRQLIEYIAVEPDPRSSSELESLSNDGYRSRRVITQGLWSTAGSLDLHLCRKPMASSVYQPNMAFAALFPDASRFDVIGREAMRTTTVDDVVQSDKIRLDAMKLDIQGAEFEVLRGASGSLSSVLLVESEVEFAPLYVGQPLVDSVTKELGDHGIEFVDYLFLYRWHPDELDGTGQLVFADALYMRAPESLVGADSEVQRKFAALAVIYGRGEMLSRLARVVGNEALKRRVQDAAALVNRATRATHAALQLSARLLRMRNNNARAHLFQ
jgi:FkbM family methyltransferase